MSSHEDNPSLLGPITLAVCGALGFFVANTSGHHAYHDILHTMVKFDVAGKAIINESLLHLINDGLMAVFFLFVGLELKREIIVGELSDLKKAAMPFYTAIGGMLVPALIYKVLNTSGPEASGWGIPMATDIAFAIGIIAVLGSRVPLVLKVLLTALAIVDDLGAILVIAIFYTAELNLSELMIALFLFVACLGLNQMGVRKLSVYMLIGVPMWYFTLKSGIHATISGVLLAATIPLGQKDVKTAHLISDIFEKKRSETDSPAVFLEKSLVPWVTFLIIPIFAFANAGVSLGEVQLASVSWGVILGLLVGKPLGVVLFAYLAYKFGLAELPSQSSWLQILGVGCLAGIGFTMSLFVTSLAFTDAALISQAKGGILLASMLSAVFGVAILSYAHKRS